MGSLAPEPDHELKAWNVLVTGFGPFLENHINPSYLVAHILPPAYNLSNLPPINIHAYPHPIDVCYTTVRDLIPTLLFAKDDTAPNIQTTYNGPDDLRIITHPPEDLPNYDIVLNIGLASGRKYYSIETCAHRDGYVKKDIHDQDLEHDTYWSDKYHAPETLWPTFDTADVWRRWKQGLLEEDLRPSNNAGRYLCEFIFYACMLEFWRRGMKARCMFLHVPSGDSEQDLERGRRVVLGLIAAAVGSEVTKRKEKAYTKRLKAEEEMKMMSEGDGC